MTVLIIYTQSRLHVLGASKRQAFPSPDLFVLLPFCYGLFVHRPFCSFTHPDTGTFIDKIMTMPLMKQNTTFRPIIGNKYSTLLCRNRVNDGLGIKSMAGLKTFVQ